MIVIAGKEDLAESQGLLDQISTIFAGTRFCPFLSTGRKDWHRESGDTCLL